MNEASVDRVLALLAGAHGEYFGEPVSQLEHALQCAHLARQAGADDELVAAALLHDIGHLVAGAAAEIGSPQHDGIGAAYLRQLGCSARVADLVAGHVDAKRYLTAVKPEYYAQLSEASQQTLALQGGPMSPEEVNHFAGAPGFADKLRLRTWDERAKEPSAKVPALDTYRAVLARI
ncbi:MAG TPA: HD domain-containing protein [Bryobacteraceae bacterium]|jgi:phosphonate degradation associated HDIG domain protein|nr:HD domain-containing protein [Bryobacteraceae bacterium]HWB98633.1 HD domain-containing protein [Bryobacteraceae bacterium]